MSPLNILNSSSTDPNGSVGERLPIDRHPGV